MKELTPRKVKWRCRWCQSCVLFCHTVELGFWTLTVASFLPPPPGSSLPGGLVLWVNVPTLGAPEDRLRQFKQQGEDASMRWQQGRAVSWSHRPRERGRPSREATLPMSPLIHPLKSWQRGQPHPAWRMSLIQVLQMQTNISRPPRQPGERCPRKRATF